jgi:hypothetical protein
MIRFFFTNAELENGGYPIRRDPATLLDPVRGLELSTKSVIGFSFERAFAGTHSEHCS